MNAEEHNKIKQVAYNNAKNSDMPKQSELGYDDLQYLLYLQFWLMYYINEYSRIEQAKLKRIAGEFEKCYGVVDLTMRREKKLKESFYKLAKGEDMELTSEDCADFTYDDWKEFADGLNSYLRCSSKLAENGRV